MLKESEEKFRVLYETMALGVVYQDADGIITSANPAAEQILGLSLEQMTGRTSVDPRWKSIHRDGSDFPGETHPSMMALKTGNPINDVIMGVYHPQLDENRWININAVPLFKPGEKKPYQVYATFADITELIRAEEALRESELRFRSMIEQTTDAVFCYEFDPPIPTHLPTKEQVKRMYDCTLVECNDVCATSYGYHKAEDVIGRKLTDLFGTTPKSLDKLFTAMVEGDYQIIDGEGVEIFEDGSERYFLNNGHGVIENDQVLRIWGTFRDITERKITEKALRESEERYQVIFDSAPDAMYLNDFKGSFLDGNKIAEQLAGYPKEELIGKNFLKLNLLPRAQIPKAAKLLALNAMGKPTGPEEFTLIQEDGTQVEVEIRSFPVKLLEQNVVLSIARDITDRKKTEKALKKSEERFRSIYENTTIGLYRTTPDGRILMANPALLQLLGYSSFEDLAKRNLEDEWYEPEYSRSRFKNRIEEEGRVIGQESAWKRSDGATVYVRESATAIKDEKGMVVYYEGTAEDITERKLAEKALQESEEKFRNIVESSPMGMHMYQLESDGSLVFTGANPAADTILGIDNSQFIGMTIEEAFPPLAESEVPGRYREAASQGTPWYEEQINYQDEQITGAYVVYAFQTSPGKMVALFLDITERKLAEKALQESEEKFRNIVESSPMGMHMYQLEPEGALVFTGANPAADTILGIDNSQFIGMTIEEAFPSSAGSEIPSRYSATASEGVPWYNEQINYQDEKITGAFEVHTFQTSPGKMTAQFLDVTERKQTEDQLKMLSLAVEQSTNSIAILDPLGRTEYLNPAALKEIDESVTKIMGKHWRASVPKVSDLRSKLREIRNTVQRDKKVWKGELSEITEDGSLRWKKTTILPITDEEGNIIHSVYINEDITERKQAEEEIFRLNEELEQRVVERTTELKATNEELEAFAYSISHDLRAPLRAINGFSNILREKYSQNLDTEGREYLENVITSTLRMDRLITDLLTLSRLGRGELNFQRINITEKVKQIFSELTKEETDRQFDFTVANCPSVEADARLLEVMLTNLLSNAIKFTRGQQTVAIEVGYLEGDEGPAYFVRDNGVGFDMAYVNKLFSPFQRLHSEDEFEGTGIGLAIVRRIVQRHAGKVWIEAEPNKGTTVYFTL